MHIACLMLLSTWDEPSGRVESAQECGEQANVEM